MGVSKIWLGECNNLIFCGKVGYILKHKKCNNSFVYQKALITSYKNNFFNNTPTNSKDYFVVKNLV